MNPNIANLTNPRHEEQVMLLRGPILVLGASGFVGANLFRMILKYRKDAIGVASRLPAWRLDGISQDQIVETNLLNAGSVESLIQRLQPMTVFNCIAYGGYSFETDPQKIYETNFTISQRLLAALAANCPESTLINAGTQSEYGLNASGPKETSQLTPNSHYAVSKASCAMLISYYGKTIGQRCCNLRLYSVYGPLEDASRLIPNLVVAAAKGALPPFGAPEISRDFIYIDDVAEAFFCAATRLEESDFGESFNIGTGVQTTRRELANTARQTFEIANEPVFNAFPNRAWDLANWYSDPSRAQERLGWKAKVTLVEGLKKTRDWYQAFAQKDAYNRLSKKTLSEGALTPKVSIVIACYKDEQAIPIMYQELKDVMHRVHGDFEIIFVNDCSPDRSEEVIKSLSAQDPRVIGITHSRNFGSQHAFRSGMGIATKDAVVLMDGDLQDPPAVIEKFIREWRKGHDVVFGRRVKREAPVYMQIAYKAFYRIFGFFSYVPIPMDAGDFSLIDRKVVKWLLACPERDLFLRGLRAYVGFNQTGIDYVRPERRFGRTTNNLFRNLEWAKRGILSFSNVPITFVSSVGILLSIASLILGLTQIVLRLMFPDIAPRGISSIVVLLMFFGGMNLLGTAIIGEYIGKVFFEVKQRPHFIRKHLIRNGQVTDWN